MTAYVYLLCFVYHRYQTIGDNLINSLIYHVRRYIDEAKSSAKEQVYRHRIEANENLHKAGLVLKLFTNDRIAESTPFSEVQAKAFSILERQKLDSVADHITTNVKFDETAFQWEHIDKLSHQFKRHLRPILRASHLETSSSQTPLAEAVHFLINAFEQGRSLRQYRPDAFPTRFIPETQKHYLYAKDTHGQRQLLVDRYEFLVYRLLRNGLETGDVFCRDSVRFRSFDDDLIDDVRWQDKDRLIALTGLKVLNQPITSHLAMLEQKLALSIIISTKLSIRVATDRSSRPQSIRLMHAIHPNTSG